MSLTATQIEARKSALTSSDAWRLLEPAQWPALAAEILAGRPEKITTPAMQRGIDQEDAICQAAAAMLHTQVHPCETVYHPNYSFILSHPDRIMLDTERKYDPGVMEAKAPAGAFVASKYLWQWTTQLQWHLLCTGHTWGALAVGWGDWKAGELDLKIISVGRNDRLCDTFIELAQEFWAIKETLCKVNR
jgi:hypothetical protein